MDFARSSTELRTQLSSFLLVFPFVVLLFSPALSAPGEISSSLEKTPIKKTLPNGLVVIFQQDESTALTALQIFIRGGTGDVPPGMDGLAYITTRLSIEIPDRNTIQEIMRQASSISMDCRGDYSLITIKCLSKNLDETLKVAAKTLLNPLFSTIRITRNKEYMRYRRKADEDNSIILAHNTQLRAFFGKDGYGSSLLGTEESLKKIRRKDIEDYYAKHFTARNTVIAVCSDLEEEDIMRTIEKFFADFTPKKPVESVMTKISLPHEKNILLEKETKQTYVSLTFPLPPASRKNFVMTSFLENLLGKGVNSKLWQLRSREKLAYNVNSHAVQMKAGGIIKAYLETENEKKEKALQSLKEILISLHEEGITEKEFEETKVSTRAHFLRLNETKAMRAANLAYFETVGLGYDFLIIFFSELEKLSYEEINSFIKQTLDPKKSVEVIIGPELK
ncbi:MAG: M16 family metallopeptidase [Candidatus Aminicenantales bacterium]